MRVPLSWLAEYAALGEPLPEPGDVARRLTAAGLEVETFEQAGRDISGVVVAEVTGIEELTGFRKPIRYCQVSTGTGEPRNVICGAVNFIVGDRVPFAPPGAVLPGGFEIGAKKAYGHMSEGMICSAAELAIGDDHSGILVLSPDAPLGADFVAYAGLADHVFDIAVTPDRGYALSIRGVARELATAYGVAYTDPADTGLPDDVEKVSPEVYPASIEDPTACDRFVLREARGFEPDAPTPLWMRVRLARCGMRSVSLAVDITNYLMLELGQPLHAFDRTKLTGPIVVRRARPGERLETLDHVVRDLDTDDILITDSSGPISMAGTMGGLATEISETSRDLVIEAAHFSAPGTARMSRRHRLFSEASYRFERGVDRELPLRASAKAVSLLAACGEASVVPGCTHASVEVPAVTITVADDYPDRVAGQAYGHDTVVQRLRDVGCEVTDPGAAVLTVIPPSWRPDLVHPSDLAEEVIRLEGYENIPARMPRAPAGHGLTAQQRIRRLVGRSLAEAGYVEVLSQPFASAADFDRLQLPASDARRTAVRLANPLTEDEPLLRTTLLPGLLRVLARNVGRGFADVALYETGAVFRPRPGSPGTDPILPVDRGPTAVELASLEAGLPAQPVRLGVVLAGDREPAGWWGGGRPAGWQDAIEAVREVLRLTRVPFRVTADQHAPWHPGRCAAIFITDEQGTERLAGHAGELHPRVVEAFRLPGRACAAEVDLSVIETAAAALGPVEAPVISPYPVATQDVALVVAASVPAAEVEAALSAGAAGAGDGSLLEEVRLFDVYTGAQAGEGNKSLAYTLRFRAPDRTLTDEEVTAARDAAVAEAGRRVGAVLRGTS
ncbi:MAG TPA: phenylalanine--tRNA ligase subunit beta [Streptosporangiaceae bacterium]|nr:phenylalanine--tRNA ligase subunit beta [Streptosporangiaceae bacterium]